MGQAQQREARGLDETGRARRELRQLRQGSDRQLELAGLHERLRHAAQGHPLQLGVAAEAEADALVQPLDGVREVAPVEGTHAANRPAGPRLRA